MMTLTEFTKPREINNDTVTMYIRRHMSEFEGHVVTQTQGKPTLLDDTAVDILSKKYKLPTQVVVDEGVKAELVEVNAKLQKAGELAEMQMKRIHELELENMQYKADKLLIEERAADKDKTIEDKQSQIDRQQATLDQDKIEMDQLRAELEEQRRKLAEKEQELAVTQKEHDTLKNMGFFSFRKWKKGAK